MPAEKDPRNRSRRKEARAGCVGRASVMSLRMSFEGAIILNQRRHESVINTGLAFSGNHVLILQCRGALNRSFQQTEINRFGQVIVKASFATTRDVFFHAEA